MRLVVVQNRDEGPLSDPELFDRLARVVLEVFRLPQDPTALRDDHMPVPAKLVHNDLIDKFLDRRPGSEGDRRIHDPADGALGVRRREGRDGEDFRGRSREPDELGGSEGLTEDVERLEDEDARDDCVRRRDGRDDIAGVFCVAA